MVKEGVLMMERLWKVMEGKEEWLWILGGEGIIRMMIESFFEVLKKDLKGIIEY